MYSEKVMDHFTSPRNVGELEDADGIGEVGNAVCGDIMRIYIKVENDVITDIKFKTFGCGAAIATSSMITEMVKGKPSRKPGKLPIKRWQKPWAACLHKKCTVPIWQQMLCIKPLTITAPKKKPADSLRWYNGIPTQSAGGYERRGG